MLKGANHEKQLKKVKVKEDELAPYRQSYEVHLQQSSLSSGSRPFWLNHHWTVLMRTDRNEEAQGTLQPGRMTLL